MTLPPLYDKIVDIFRDELKKRIDGYEVTGTPEGGKWMMVRFKSAKDRQSVSFAIDKGMLELADVYVPEAIRNQGFMTSVLSRIRKLDGINGKCMVYVAMDQKGWKTIVSRAGFEWVQRGIREL
jgi:hypothetical protein